jgi:hypothetical protein
MCGNPNSLLLDIWWVQEEEDESDGGDGGDDGGGDDGGGNNGTATDACYNLMSNMTATEAGQFGWDAISPFMRGRLLYAPKNKFVETIMKQVLYN